MDGQCISFMNLATNLYRSVCMRTVGLAAYICVDVKKEKSGFIDSSL